MNLSIDIIFIPVYLEKAAAVSNMIVEFFIVAAGGWYLIHKNFISVSLKPVLNSAIASLILLPVVYLLRYYHFSPLLTVIISVVSLAIGHTLIYLRFSGKQSQVRKLFSLV